MLRCIKGTYLDSKIERSVYNKCRRKLFFYLEQIRKVLSQKLSKNESTFVVDSTPVAICKFSRAKRSSICSTKDIQPSFGYKLHAVCAQNGVIHSFDFTPANVHDIHYLNEVKHKLSYCTLIGDKGYISADYQADLFTQSNIQLAVPMRKIN